MSFTESKFYPYELTMIFFPERLENHRNVVEKRADELVECMLLRRNEDGAIDMAECIHHWTCDVMVSNW